MSDETYITELKYKGGRFESGELPLDALDDLVAFKDLLFIFAKEQFLKDNPGRTQVPTEILEGIDVALSGIRPGSTAIDLKFSFADNDNFGPGKSIPSDPRKGIINSSYQSFVKTISDKKLPDFIRSTHRDKALTSFKKFGKNLDVGERIKFSENFGGSVSDQSTTVIELNQSAREQIETNETGYSTKKYKIADAFLKGIIPNSPGELSRLEFISPSIGRFTIQVPYGVYASEFTGGTNREFKLSFEALVGPSGKIHKVENLIEAERKPHKLVDRLASFGDLKKGWLENNLGEPISLKIIDMASEFLESSEALPNFYALSPTEDGGVLFEYRLKEWDYGIEFTPQNKIEFFGVKHGCSDEIDITFENDDFSDIRAQIAKTYMLSEE